MATIRMEPRYWLLLHMFLADTLSHFVHSYDDNDNGITTMTTVICMWQAQMHPRRPDILPHERPPEYC